MGNIQSAATCVVSARRSEATKALLRCAEAGDVAELGALLDSDARGVLLSSVFGGNTAWHKAAKAGRVDVLEALKAAVLQQYARDSKDLAAEAVAARPSVLRLGGSAVDAVARLINKGNMKGCTPLMLACSGAHTDAVSWLIQHGADLWRHDRVRRHTALHCAAEAGATDAIRLLLARAGPEVHPGNGKTLLEQGNHAGLTPLHYAVFCDQDEVVAQLVAQDADISAQAEFPDLDWGSVNAGDTAMHVAAQKGNIEVITIMLKAYNERSGALMPSGARRLRDPRAMRNDYGRLPYHLAMRKGFSWLSEMLDPSVPVRFLLTDEQLEASTAWGPPRLATIAAAVLHKSLVADLKAIQAAQQAAATAAAAAANRAPADEQPSAQQEPCGSDLAAPASSGANASGGRRRWGGRPGHQRSASDVTSSWVNRLTEASPRPFSSARSRRQARATAASPPAATAAASDAGEPTTPRSSGRASAPAGFSPPPSLSLHEALGATSPRTLIAALMAGSSAGGGLPSAGAAASGSSEGAADAGASSSSAARERTAVPSSPSGPSSTLGALARQARLASRQAHQAGSSSTAGASLRSPARHHQQPELLPGDGSELQPCDLLLCSVSDSGCLTSGHHAAELELCADTKLVADGELQLGDSEQQHDAEASSSKLSPLPGLQSGRPSGVIENLLKQLAAELKRPGTTSPEAAAAGLEGVQQHCISSSAGSTSDEGQVCSVCLDAPPNTVIEPCQHTMCAGCALDMVERCPLATAICPLCRCVIGRFRQQQQQQHPPACAGGMLHVVATAAVQ